jgi:hypothetical protein
VQDSSEDVRFSTLAYEDNLKQDAWRVIAKEIA